MQSLTCPSSFTFSTVPCLPRSPVFGHTLSCVSFCSSSRLQAVGVGMLERWYCLDVYPCLFPAYVL